MDKPSKQVIKDQIALLSYVDKLIEERQDPHITEKALPKVREYLLARVNEAINSHLVNLLTEKDREELEKLLDSNAHNDFITEFFEKKIPNLETEIAAVLLDFRTGYLYPQTNNEEEKVAAPPPPTPAPTDSESISTPPNLNPAPINN
jgi:hypothetical protein